VVVRLQKSWWNLEGVIVPPQNEFGLSVRNKGQARLLTLVSNEISLYARKKRGPNLRNREVRIRVYFNNWHGFIQFKGFGPSLKMAVVHVTTSSILSSFLPRLSVSTVSNVSRFTTLYSRQLSHPTLPSFTFAIPSAIQLNVPGLLERIWESILWAVPKKKTSHMKKRHRQMAGKALKDVTALNKCSACGHVKRAHLLCPYCVKGELSMG